jgi:hypothetical protein
VKTTSYKREQGVHTRSRAEAREARKVNADWQTRKSERPWTDADNMLEASKRLAEKDADSAGKSWATGRAARRAAGGTMGKGAGGRTRRRLAAARLAPRKVRRVGRTKRMSI